MQLSSSLVFLAVTVSSALAGELIYPARLPVPRGLYERQEDPNTSLTLDPRCINKGSGQDGQDPPVDGQVKSDISTNNFINECLNHPDLAITNGEQILQGSFAPTPIGAIFAKDKQPSCAINSPQNGDVIEPNTTFDIRVETAQQETGFFTSATSTYYAAPQKLNAQGLLQGHNHVVVQQIASLNDNKPLNPVDFKFFKGLNNAAQNNILTATVTGGLAEGFYKLCTILTGANHMAAIGPVAQRGSYDDCVRFQVAAGGGNAGNGGGNNAGNGGGANAGNGNGAGNGGGANAGNGNGNGAGNGANDGGANAGNGGNGNGDANATSTTDPAATSTDPAATTTSDTAAATTSAAAGGNAGNGAANGGNGQGQGQGRGQGRGGNRGGQGQGQGRGGNRGGNGRGQKRSNMNATHGFARRSSQFGSPLPVRRMVHA